PGEGPAGKSCPSRAGGSHLRECDVRGVVLSEGGVALEEVTLDPPGEHEVRVRVVANGLCHTDLHVIETGGWGMRLPVLLGHEGAGIVEELGPGVTTVTEGDRRVGAGRPPSR